MSRVLTALVADRAAIRLGIRMALTDTVHVCAEAASGEEAVTAAAREQPDLCLLARVFAGERMAVVSAILEASPGTAVIVLGGEEHPEFMLDAVRAGAMGYVPGEVDMAGLRRMIGAVGAGEAAIPRGMVHELVHELHAAHESLTRREFQVLRLVRRGQSTVAIAERLEIAPVTVRRHISELTRKLGVANRSELARATPGAAQTRPRRTA